MLKRWFAKLEDYYCQPKMKKPGDVAPGFFTRGYIKRIIS